MGKKIRNLVLLLLTAFCIFALSVRPAFANVDPTWEESRETEEEESDKKVVDENEGETHKEATKEDPLSTPGNGSLGDEIKSGMKDFYTIHTKNNNTFYLVVDHAGNQDNVYMLSLIDEKDLSEFLDQTGEETEPEKPVVILPETTQVPETQAVAVPEPAEKPNKVNSNLITLILFAVVGGGAALYYFKVYKPRKEADEWESENLETSDGLETENEDETIYKGDRKNE